MVDFHTHILPNIDDGSHSVEESIIMLKESYKQGVDTLVLSSHFRCGEMNIKEFLKDRQDRLDEIRFALTDEDREVIPKCILGAEIEHKNKMDRWDYLDKLTISGTNYLFTEMPFIPWDKRTVDAIDNIALNSEFIPILPHIDRYFTNFTNPLYIEHYYKMPVLIQMNCIFITNNNNIDVFKPLLDEGKIHLLGSDCHGWEWRTPNMGPCREKILEVCAPGVMERIEAKSREVIKDAIYVDM